MGFLQLFDKYYESADPKLGPRPGDIYWVPVPETPEVPQILDVERATPQEHHVTGFEFVQIDPGVHYRDRDRLPIQRLNLGNTEELLVAKSKKRPAVVLSNCVVEDVDTLPAGAQQRLARPFGKCCFLVAPLYTVARDMRQPRAFAPELVARIRAMQYLHFVCLPDRHIEGRPDSVLRLDRIFPSYLGRGCDRYYGLRLAEEPMHVVLAAACKLMGGGDPRLMELYSEVKALSQEALP